MSKIKSYLKIQIRNKSLDDYKKDCVLYNALQRQRRIPTKMPCKKANNSFLTKEEFKGRRASIGRLLIKSAVCPQCNGTITKRNYTTIAVDYNMVGAYKCPHCKESIRGQYLDANGVVR